MSEQTQPETALQSLAEKLRTDAIAIFGEGQAERDIIEWFYGSLLAAAPAQPAVQEAYPECDYCGVTPDHHPWHGSGLLGGVESRHIHACDSCRHLLPASPAQPEVQSLREALSAFTAWGESVGLSPALQTVGELKAFKAGAEWQARAALSPARENVREWIPVSERLPADSRDVLVYCSDTDEHMVGSSMGCGRFAFAFSERGTRICCKPSHWRYIDEGDKPAALAASTGQEVGK